MALPQSLEIAERLIAIPGSGGATAFSLVSVLLIVVLFVAGGLIYEASRNRERRQLQAFVGTDVEREHKRLFDELFDHYESPLPHPRDPNGWETRKAERAALTAALVEFERRHVPRRRWLADSPQAIEANVDRERLARKARRNQDAYYAALREGREIP